MTKPSSALWERNILEAMLSVPFVPLSICPRSNIYVSLLNSEPSFLSGFLLCWSLTTFTLLHSAAARLSVPPRRLCYLTFPVSALLRQPFGASFMFFLINCSISDAKAKRGSDWPSKKLKMISIFVASVCVLWPMYCQNNADAYRSRPFKDVDERSRLAKRTFHRSVFLLLLSANR